MIFDWKTAASLTNAALRTRKRRQMPPSLKYVILYCTFTVLYCTVPHYTILNSCVRVIYAAEALTLTCTWRLCWQHSLQCVYLYIHVHLCVYIYIYMYMHLQRDSESEMRMCCVSIMYTHYIYIYIYTCIYIYIYVYIYVYIYIYNTSIDTHTYTNTCFGGANALLDDA